MNEKSKKLIDECERMEESCLYTSTTFFIWLRSIRFWRSCFIVLPIVFGALASWSVFQNSSSTPIIFLVSVFTLVAGMLPAIYKALNFDARIGEISVYASKFKSLQDRFRKAANVTSLEAFEVFDEEFSLLMNQLDDARSRSLTPPERFFKKAQKKIATGDYNFDADEGRT